MIQQRHFQLHHCWLTWQDITDRVCTCVLYAPHILTFELLWFSGCIKLWERMAPPRFVQIYEQREALAFSDFLLSTNFTTEPRWEARKSPTEKKIDYIFVEQETSTIRSYTGSKCIIDYILYYLLACLIMSFKIDYGNILSVLCPVSAPGSTSCQVTHNSPGCFALKLLYPVKLVNFSARNSKLSSQLWNSV